MLQFFEWFWNAIGLYEKLGIAKEIVVDGTTLQVSFQGFMNWLHGDLLEKGESLSAALIFSAGILICTIIPYLLGSLNAAIIVSKYKYHDDIRKYGSGNAGMTNMGRVFGKQGALLTLVGDMLKQFVAVIIGIIACGELGAYFAGVFCMLGHIAPVFYHFRGGKGVLTAATMILMIDWQVFLVAGSIFALTVLITRYVSLGSILAGFSLPAIVYVSATMRGTYPSLPALCFSLFIGMLLIFMHRSNIRRLFNGNENKVSFGKKKK